MGRCASVECPGGVGVLLGAAGRHGPSGGWPGLQPELYDLPVVQVQRARSQRDGMEVE